MTDFLREMFFICPERLLLLTLMFGCCCLGTTLNESAVEVGFDDDYTPSYDQEDSTSTDESGYQEVFVGAGFRPLLTSDIHVVGNGAGFLPPRTIDADQHDTSSDLQEEHSSIESSTYIVTQNGNGSINGSGRKIVIERYYYINITKYVPISPESNKRHLIMIISQEARRFLTGSLSTIIIPSFYTLVCLLSVPINIWALLIFIRRIKPKTLAVIYMMNLACADLLFSMVLPFKISYHFTGNDWIFGPAMCRIVTAAFYWNMYCSVLLISLISVDRLLAVVYPIQSLSWRSPAKAVISCAAMWILSFLGSMHLLFTEQTFNLTELNITTCHDIQPSQPFLCYKMYYIILCFLLFFLPLIITLVSYTQVIFSLIKVQPGVPDHSQKKRRAMFLTATVLVMFVLCFLPTNIVFLVHQLMYSEEIQDPENEGNPDRLYIIYSVCLSLGSLNCILDPLVYYFGSSCFQKEVSSMLKCQKTKQSTSGGQSSPGQSNPSVLTTQTDTKSNHKEN
ncbi:proteinase-activated receptor 1-like isoform X2 [Cheilinus undulatus]|uniref:proteinase-activated receptor 1-like isoform X2 n=1 Tax=Cheilinus undulatus TaxID=241271 RepID=UPI001BD43AAF|nr:proteinase-activated receptor 1-like isoform X2 [Cheilinus undulatus]